MQCPYCNCNDGHYSNCPIPLGQFNMCHMERTEEGLSNCVRDAIKILYPDYKPPVYEWEDDLERDRR